MTDSQWWRYVQRLDPGASKDRLAKTIGVTPSTITRWSQGRSPAADAVIQAARAYGRSPLEALLAAALITQEESQGSWSSRTIDDHSILELLDEVRERVAVREPVTAFSFGQHLQILGPDGGGFAIPGHRPMTPAEEQRYGPAMAEAARRAQEQSPPQDLKAVAFDPGHLPEDEPEIFD